MASDQASGQEAARSALLRRRVGSSIDSNSQQNLGAGGKDSNSSRYGQESQRTSRERAEPNIAMETEIDFPVVRTQQAKAA
jgi:hypothetical protein